ncbi:MAG: iron-containing alcohol dehydrogenase [Turneriella sp.]|nr:iron-containing alcohol dehydrogenase [Turneriella sp.]
MAKRLHCRTARQPHRDLTGRKSPQRKAVATLDFQTTRRIIAETGAVRRIGALARELGIAHALVVTDAGIHASGLTEDLAESLAAADIRVSLYTDVVPDPPEAVVLEAVARARDVNIDGVIGFGGGSSMDVAKVIAVLANSKQKIAEIYGIGNVRSPRLPLIQVPTTAGTGSEVTPIAIITTGETTKTGIVSPQLLPDIALLDAALTRALPPHVTAATGIDAMVHAIEAFTSKIKKNPYSDLLAMQALRLLSANITRAVTQGNDLTARENMLYGAMLAGQAFANAPVAAVHALAYPLGGHYHISHGLSNSLMLPHVIAFNLPAAEKLYEELCPALFPFESEKSSADVFLRKMNALIDATSLPKTLSAMKIPQNDLPMLARDAMLQQRLLVNNPRPVTENDALQLYQAAW